MGICKPGDTRHYLPRGGMFRYVTSANYFGELTEWTGFAILTWSWAGAVFALFTGHHCGVSLALLFDLRAFPGERQIEHADDGELTEWTGFAILTWSWAGAVFALWTFANLAPRALKIRRRYIAEFGPLKQKSIMFMPPLRSRPRPTPQRWTSL